MARRRARRHDDRGAVGASASLAEIVLFAVSGRLPPFFPAEVLLMIGAAGGALALGGDGARSAGLSRYLGCNCCTRLLSAPPISARSVLSRATRRPAKARPRKVIWRSPLGVTMAARDRTVGLALRRFGSGAYVAMALAAVAGGVSGMSRTGRAVKRRSERTRARSIRRSQLATMPVQRAALHVNHLRDRPPCRLIQCRTGVRIDIPQRLRSHADW